MARHFFNVLYSVFALGGLAYGVTAYFGLEAANVAIGSGFLLVSRLLPAVAALTMIYYFRHIWVWLGALIGIGGAVQGYLQGGFDPLPGIWAQTVELYHLASEHLINYWSWVSTTIG